MAKKHAFLDPSMRNQFIGSQTRKKTRTKQSKKMSSTAPVNVGWQSEGVMIRDRVDEVTPVTMGLGFRGKRHKGDAVGTVQEDKIVEIDGRFQLDSAQYARYTKLTARARLRGCAVWFLPIWARFSSLRLTGGFCRSRRLSRSQVL